MSERYDRLRRIRREKKASEKTTEIIEKDYEERTWLVHIDTDSGYTWLWFCCIWIPDGIYGRTIHGADTDGWRIVSGQ